VRDPVPPPADYVTFVAGHADRLYAAAYTLTGDGPAAETLTTDLFAATARRWSALRPRAGTDVGDQDAARAYVGRLFRREAASYRSAGFSPRLAAPGAGAAPTAEDLAASAWAKGRGVRRRRSLLLAVGVALVVTAVLVRPGAPSAFRADGTGGMGGGHGGPTQSAQPPTSVPAGVDLLPPSHRFASLPLLPTRLPERVELSRPVGSLRSNPVPFAIAAFRPNGGSLMVLGPDGRVRTVADPPGMGNGASLPPGAPVDAARPVRLPSTALSRDGTAIAQLTGEGMSVLNVRTGKLMRFPTQERLRWVAWLDGHRLLAGGLNASMLVDLSTGRTVPAAIPARTTLTPRAGANSPGSAAAAAPAVPRENASLLLPRDATPPPDYEIARRPAPVDVPGVMELLPVGEPATAPARLRRHLEGADGIRIRDTALSGDLTGWVGPWRGAGFVTPLFAVRDCTPIGELPAAYGEPTLATVAVDPASGDIRRILVTVDAQAGPPQLLGASDAGVALIRTDGADGTINVLGWRMAIGKLYRVATIDKPASVAIADLAAFY
jgi:hypothetical protein